MRRTAIGRVMVGGVYRYTRTRCRYRVLGFALCGRTLQVQVVYEGLDDADLGLWFVCPTYDFAVKFEPEATPAPPAVEERNVPHPQQTGAGW